MEIAETGTVENVETGMVGIEDLESAGNLMGIEKEKEEEEVEKGVEIEDLDRITEVEKLTGTTMISKVLRGLNVEEADPEKTEATEEVILSFMKDEKDILRGAENARATGIILVKEGIEAELDEVKEDLSGTGEKEVMMELINQEETGV